MQQFGRLVFTIERSKKLTDVASLISLQRFYSTNVDTPSDDPQVVCQAPASSPLSRTPLTQVDASAAVHVPDQLRTLYTLKILTWIGSFPARTVGQAARAQQHEIRNSKLHRQVVKGPAPARPGI